jgi:hypothetical protein
MQKNLIVFLISNFRRVLNIVCFLLGNSPTSEFYTYRPMKMQQSVPKRRLIKFRRWGITQKKAYNNLNSVIFSNLWDTEKF